MWLIGVWGGWPEGIDQTGRKERGEERQPVVGLRPQSGGR